MKNAFSVKKLDLFFRENLDIDGFASVDDSLNGLQIDNDGSEITKIAFAVDSSLDGFRRAAEIGAGMLFVHHGLFWGPALRIQGSLRERIKALLDNNIALYGVHLPLDHHPVLGNNGVLAGLLGLENPEPFGLYHDRKIGYKGKLSKALTVEEAVSRIGFMGRPPSGVFPFGRELNATAAVISGGAPMEALQAIDEGVDLYVTGECSHTVYHHALESRMNIIAGGHYSTEVWGVRKVMELCGNRLNIDTEFIDIPTGL